MHQVTIVVLMLSFFTRIPSAVRNSQHHIRYMSSSFIDPLKYLEDIESEIRRGDSSYKIKLRSQWAKPMIRTILGIHRKDEFDLLTRLIQKRVEFERMNNFIHDLWSRIQTLSEEDRNKVPEFANSMLEAQSKQEKGYHAFSRLASGKRYKGQMEDLVADLVPDLVYHYQNISNPLTEDEILKNLIEVIGKERSIDPKRIDAAYGCIQLFNDDNEGTGMNLEQITCKESKGNGRKSEKECEVWLRDQTSGTVNQPMILKNVMINDVSTRSRSKYNKRHIWQGNRKCEDLSIIWTNRVRNRMCSEFDAIVINEIPSDEEANMELREFWEAKASISPSSIHDSITKKLAAARSIINDESAMLTHSGSDHALKRAEGNLRFGLFGSGLMTPANALGQLRSTAAAYILSTDIETAMNSADTGFVEIDSQILLQDLNRLKQILQDINDFDIVVKIASF